MSVFLNMLFFLWTGLAMADKSENHLSNIEHSEEEVLSEEEVSTDSNQQTIDDWDVFFDDNLQLTLDVLAIITDHNSETIVPNRRGINGQTALHLISRSGYIPMAEFFINTLKVDINLKNDKGNTPLLEMVCTPNVNLSKEQSIAMATILLDNGADVNEQNDKGQTVVDCLAASGQQHLLPLYESHKAKNSRG